MALQREVLADEPEVRQEDLRTPRIAEATHATLPFACRLMTVFDSVIQPSTGFDEDMFDVRQLEDLGFRGRVATQLVSDDLPWHLRTCGEDPLEKPFGCRFVATLLQQHVEFGAVLVDRPLQQIRLATQGDKHFVEMPCGAGLTASGLDAMGEALAEFVAPAPDRLIADNDAALE